jgi:hypothetical protein
MNRREPYRTDTLPPTLAGKERALWVAVLEAARDELHSDATPAKDRESLRAWFASEEVVCQSYAWICEVLGLDPDAVRVAYATPAKPYQRAR